VSFSTIINWIGFFFLPLTFSLFFRDVWTEAKFLLLIFATLLVILFTCHEKKVTIPKLNITSKIFLLLGFSLSWLVTLIQTPQEFPNLFLHHGSFLVLFLFGISRNDCDLKKIAQPLQWSLILISSYGILQYLGYQPIHYLKHGIISSTFGNDVMLGEYLGFSIFILLLIFFEDLSCSKKNFFTPLVILLSFSYYFLSGARASFLAFLVIFGIWGFGQKRWKNKKSLYWLLGLFLASCILIQSLPTPTEGAKSVTNKIFLDMIKKNPGSGIVNRIELRF